MREKTAFDAVLGALTALLVYVAYKMFAPFLLAFFWAVVLSLAFYPLYLFFLARIKREEAAAVLVVLISFIAIAGPLSYISYLLVYDIKFVLAKLTQTGAAMPLKKESLMTSIEKVAGPLHLDPNDIYDSLTLLANNIKRSMLNVLNARVFGVVNAIVDYFIMLFAMFFLLKDGHLFTENIARFIPMNAVQKERIFARVKEVIVATLYGGVLIGIIQGAIGGVSFFLLGVPSPVLLGFMMFLFSFIPVVGAFAIWGPVSAYLFLSGSVAKGFIMVAIGVIVLVGFIDHYLKPMIIGGRTKIHILLIFFGVIGGMHLFGIIGFIAGPLIIALLLLSLQMITAEISGTRVPASKKND